MPSVLVMLTQQLTRIRGGGVDRDITPSQDWADIILPTYVKMKQEIQLGFQWDSFGEKHPVDRFFTNILQKNNTINIIFHPVRYKLLNI